MTIQNKSYCRYPFDSITVTNTGHMQMCCYAEWTGVLDTEETNIKDIGSIEDWFTGKYLAGVRQCWIIKNYQNVLVVIKEKSNMVIHLELLLTKNIKEIYLNIVLKELI